MMYTVIIDVVFRFINFAVLIVLFVWGFKKYALGSILKQRKEKRRYIRGLQEQRKALKHQMQLVIDTIQKEKDLCGRLQKKVALWRTSIEQEINERSEQRAELEKQQSKRVEKQEQFLKVHNAYKTIHPKVIEQTRALLEKKFRDEKVSNAYNNKILSVLTPE